MTDQPLTPDEEAFCAAAIKLDSLTQAWRTVRPDSKANDNTAKKEAHKWGERPHVKARILDLRQRALAKAQAKTELSIERTLLELGRVICFDPRRLYREDGTMIPVRELDDDTAAALASVETRELPGGVIGRKIKSWDKNGAIGLAMRHFGLFEKDNAQVQDNIRVEVVLVQPPAQARAG